MGEFLAVMNGQGSFTRPNNTTTYDSGDLVSNSTTASEVVPIEIVLDKFRHSMNVYIRRVRLIKSNPLITDASFRVHFFDSQDITVSNGDGGAFLTNNASNYLGSIGVVAEQSFTDGSVGLGAPDVGNEISFISDNEKVYALIEAEGTYTPTANETFTLITEAHRY